VWSPALPFNMSFRPWFVDKAFQKWYGGCLGCFAFHIEPHSLVLSRHAVPVSGAHWWGLMLLHCLIQRSNHLHKLMETQQQVQCMWARLCVLVLYCRLNSCCCCAWCVLQP
jgi:hypothetical protein